MANMWYYGPSGSGKSTRAFADATENTYVYEGGYWTNLTSAHTHIIIDDIKPGFMTLRELCRLSDSNFPIQLRTSETTSVTLNKRRITVTSLFKPDALFEEDTSFDIGSRNQLANRFRIEGLGRVDESDDESLYEGGSEEPTTSDEDFIVSDSEYD